MVNSKQRDLLAMRKASYYNNSVYEDNITNIAVNVKTHWNKKILDPKVDL